MNIATMHIGLDIGLQKSNSNVFGSFQREEKDYALNNTITSFILAVLNKGSNSIYSIESYIDISKYYAGLHPFIRTEELNKVEVVGNNYVSGEFLKGIIIEKIDSGTLRAGIKYKVISAGSTDLTLFGYKVQPVVGETFTCVIPNGSNTDSLVIGEEYRIINADTIEFTGIAEGGAANNYPGTVFISTGTTPGGTPTVNSVWKHITDIPAGVAIDATWTGDTELIPISNDGYFEFISSRSNVDHGNYITSGDLTIGKTYRVVVAGDADLSGVGGYVAEKSDDGDNGLLFIATATDVTWTSGTTKLIETKEVENRLVKVQDLDSLMNHSYGTVVTSPYSILADGEIRVYHANKFKINRIYIDYIRKPVEVNYTDGIDSDVAESLHNTIVDLTVQHIAGTVGMPTYSTIVNENRDEEQLKQ